MLWTKHTELSYSETGKVWLKTKVQILKLMIKYMKTHQDLIKLNGYGKWFKQMYLIKYIK